MLESNSIMHRSFLGFFFYFLCQLAEGTG